MQRVTISTNIALGLLTDMIFSLKDACYCQTPLQYVYTMIRYIMRCNIVDITNQLLFAYRGLVSEFRIFVTLFIDITKATVFIQVIQEKQEV